MLICIVDLGRIVFDSNCCVNGFFICVWIVCLSGWVLNIGLNLVLVSLFMVEVDSLSL